MPDVGRPSSYDPEFAKQAAKLCALGATDSDLANFFEVSVRTIYRWMNEFKEFCHAVKVAKQVADDRVERALYHRAIGYNHEAVKIFMPAGAEEPVFAPYVEHVPPDPTSMIFWLKNRQSAKWRDVHKHEHGAPGEFANLSESELRKQLLELTGETGDSPSDRKRIRAPTLKNGLH